MYYLLSPPQEIIHTPALGNPSEQDNNTQNSCCDDGYNGKT
nr:MAG TPA: hypothetical protein [Crassvirales sp.]